MANGKRKKKGSSRTLKIFSVLTAEDVMRAGRVDCLEKADFIGPATIMLHFADGKTYSLDIKRLEMPLDRLHWRTVRASPDGSNMTIKAIKGEVIPIDSSSLRYLVDTDYAKGIDDAMKSLRLTGAEMDKMVRESHPPQEWYSEPEPDLRLESWK